MLKRQELGTTKIRLAALVTVGALIMAVLGSGPGAAGAATPAGPGESDPEPFTITDCDEQFGVFTASAADAAPYLPEGFTPVGVGGEPLPEGRVAVLPVLSECGGPGDEEESHQLWTVLVVEPPEEYRKEGAAHYMLVRGLTDSETVAEAYQAWGVPTMTLGDIDLDAGRETGVSTWTSVAEDEDGVMELSSTSAQGHPPAAGASIRIFGVENGELTGSVDVEGPPWKGGFGDAVLAEQSLFPFEVDERGAGGHAWAFPEHFSPGPKPQETGAEAADHTVVMGAVDPILPADLQPSPATDKWGLRTPGRADRFEYLAYYPQVLRVHPGDTVYFRRDGFQTMTYTPPGESRTGFARPDEYGEYDEDGNPIGGDSAVASMYPVAPGQGDAERPLEIDCGIEPDLPPCVLSSTDQFVSSGWNSFYLTIDLPVGTTIDYYSAEVTGMEGRIQVVPDTVPLPTEEEIEEARRAKVLEDTANAEALMEYNNENVDSEPLEGGRVKWFVKAGDHTDDGRVAINRNMPANLEIAPGDEVEFLVPGEAKPRPFASEGAAMGHTVTFPDDANAKNVHFVKNLNAVCDPDHPTQGLSGAPASGWPTAGAALATDTRFFCPADTGFEFLLVPTSWENPGGPAWWTGPVQAPGDVVATPATQHDSGLITRDGDSCRSACDPWTGERWPASFDAKFPNEGTFTFRCLVHAPNGMAGSITVADPDEG